MFTLVAFALRGIGPFAIAGGRNLIAAIALYPIAIHSEGGGLRSLSGAWRYVAVVGFLNLALPNSLVAFGQQYVDSGVAAIVASSVPLFVTLFALWLLPLERPRGLQVWGLLLGMLGVALIAGVNPSGGWPAVGGTIAVTGAAASWGLVIVYAARGGRRLPVRQAAFGCSLVAGLMVVPLAAYDLVRRPPSATSVAVVVGAGLGTAALQLNFFRMLRAYGASRTSLVTYVIPLFAVLFGSLLLGEPLRAVAFGGMILILASVALASGIVARPTATRVGAAGEAAAGGSPDV
jgi:drug/metabolite transporter (DMT)-like permease